MRHEPGETLDRYTIERFIGEGGMGEIYVAFDPRLRRRVALKILRARNSSVATGERLLREARAVASFVHPNVVAIHDVLDLEDQPCLVMEFIEGQTLRSAVGDGSISIDRKLRYLVSIARALDAAHASGIVHRDLKPDNVMIQGDDTVKVLDFGIAKRVDAPHEEPSSADDVQPQSVRTAEGTVIGTPAYMAPEQLAGWPIDARVDQFAWGVMAVELLTGTRPTPMSPAVAAHVLDGIVPKSVVDVVIRALSRLAVDRFPSMSDLADALDPSTKTQTTEALRAGIASQEATTVDQVAHTTTTKIEEKVAPTTGASVVPIPRPPPRRWSKLLLLALAVIAGAAGFAYVRHDKPTSTAPSSVPMCTARALSPPTPIKATLRSVAVMTRPGGVELAVLGLARDKALVLASIEPAGVRVRTTPPPPGRLAEQSAIAVLFVHQPDQYVLQIPQLDDARASTLLYGRTLSDDVGRTTVRLETSTSPCTLLQARLASVSGQVVPFALCDTQDAWELRAFGPADGTVVHHVSTPDITDLHGPFVADDGQHAHVAVTDRGELLHGWFPVDAEHPILQSPSLASNAGSPALLVDGEKAHVVWIDRGGGALHHAVVHGMEIAREDAPLGSSDGSRPAFVLNNDVAVVAWAQARRIFAGCGTTMAKVVSSSVVVADTGVTEGPFIVSIDARESLVTWLQHDMATGTMWIHRAMLTCPHP